MIKKRIDRQVDDGRDGGDVPGSRRRKKEHRVNLFGVHVMTIT